MLTEKKKAKKHSAYKMRETESDYSWDLNVEKKALKKSMSDASDNEITIKAAAKVAKKHKVRRKDVLATVKPASKAKGERTWDKEGNVLLKESAMDDCSISPNKGYFYCTDISGTDTKVVSQLPKGESHFGGAYVTVDTERDLAILNTQTEDNSNGIPLTAVLYESNDVALVACYELAPDVEYFIVKGDTNEICTGIYKGTQLEALSYLDNVMSDFGYDGIPEGNPDF